jgi:hypothetical protein
MDFRKNALLRMGDKILKAFEKAEQFDKARVGNEYKDKIELLKSHLLERYKEYTNSSVSKLKLQLLNTDIDSVRSIHHKKALTEQDKRLVNFLMKKYQL